MTGTEAIELLVIMVVLIASWWWLGTRAPSMFKRDKH